MNFVQFPSIWLPILVDFWSILIRFSFNFGQISLKFGRIFILNLVWHFGGFLVNFGQIFLEFRSNFPSIFLEIWWNFHSEFGLTFWWIFGGFLVKFSLNFGQIFLQFRSNFLWISVKFSLNFPWNLVEFSFSIWFDILVDFWSILVKFSLSFLWNLMEFSLWIGAEVPVDFPRPFHQLSFGKFPSFLQRFGQIFDWKFSRNFNTRTEAGQSSRGGGGGLKILLEFEEIKDNWAGGGAAKRFCGFAAMLPFSRGQRSRRCFSISCFFSSNQNSDDFHLIYSNWLIENSRFNSTDFLKVCNSFELEVN